jgi:hypothetical protein
LYLTGKKQGNGREIKKKKKEMKMKMKMKEKVFFFGNHQKD